MAALCGLAAGVIFLVPAIVMWLWNRTMPDIFRLPTIAYWQAFRLFILCMILFGGGAHNC
ncbi:MAG: hypothetical protein CME07_03240 [Gemmatimonadetes bacterium]|nr:hypothetical protein [Gemmatimonadota bacterium]